VKTIVDSSGWIEFLSSGPRAGHYASYVSRSSDLLTPTVVLYEVYKRIKRERGEEAALASVGQLHATVLVPLSDSIALLAADVSLRDGLAMADAIIYATALEHSAQIVTSDADLKDLPNVIYIR
jgi:predicted nucleic acid-binding protein